MRLRLKFGWAEGIAVVVILLVLYLVTAPLGIYQFQGSTVPWSLHTRARRIGREVEAYHDHFGRYPVDQAELISSALAKRADFVDPAFGFSIIYYHAQRGDAGVVEVEGVGRESRVFPPARRKYPSLGRYEIGRHKWTIWFGYR